MNCILIDKINFSKQVLVKKKEVYPSNSELFKRVKAAYNKTAKIYTFLKYDYPSIKSSMWGKLGNYAGFTGYYNPFTGEAQLNTTILKFLQPYTACHEVAHQLGYGKENEANFSGFLACRMHPSSAFRYSVYFDMYSYTIGELLQKDTAAARHFIDSLNPLVRKDFKEVREFFNRYKNPIEPVISWMYSGYLKANRQPAGRETYSQVVAFLIAYQRKFGKEAL